MNSQNNKGMAAFLLGMKVFSLGGGGIAAAKPLVVGTKAVTIAIVASQLFVSCDNNPDEALPITVTIEVPAEHTHLAPGAKITVVFPANFNTSRLEAIRGKLVDSLEILDEMAKDPTFQGKIRAILARGLKITIEETDSVTYGTKVVDNQLVVETAFLEHAGVGGGQIAAGIISMINNGHLVAKASQVPVTPTTV